MFDDFIHLDRVSKTYGTPTHRFDALKNVTLSIGKGEHVTVVGKSGSGKSTFLNMLTGIDHPTSGTVEIDKTEPHNLDESRLATWRGKSVGIVFQFFQLIPTLTIRENVLLAIDFVGVIPKKDREARVKELLELTGILSHADKLPAALSGGEQQRAAIARALANDPPILVADEPTGNLDTRNSEMIFSLFDELVKSGKTLIVVTHERESLTRDDRIITLHDGEILHGKRS